MKTKWKVALAVGAVILLAGAAADLNRHFPGGITLSGNSHVYTDSGTELQRDGVAVGGGGASPWTNETTLIGGNAITLVEPTNIFHLMSTNGAIYIGTPGAVSNNWTKGTPSIQDVLIAEANGSFGSAHKLAVDLESYLDDTGGALSQFQLILDTNNMSMFLTAEGAGGGPYVNIGLGADGSEADSASISINGSGFKSVNLYGDGTISATRANKWAFGPQTAPGGTTNLTVLVDGQWYQVVGVPIPPP